MAAVGGFQNLVGGIEHTGKTHCRGCETHGLEGLVAGEARAVDHLAVLYNYHACGGAEGVPAFAGKITYRIVREGCGNKRDGGAEMDDGPGIAIVGGTVYYAAFGVHIYAVDIAHARTWEGDVTEPCLGGRCKYLGPGGAAGGGSINYTVAVDKTAIGAGEAEGADLQSLWLEKIYIERAEAGAAIGAF